jgi:hypothetical protein
MIEIILTVLSWLAWACAAVLLLKAIVILTTIAQAKDR